jgi:sulfate/thiosulfate transport system permease protein
MADRRFNVLPGFGLTMGYALLYLGLIVLLPLAGLFLRLAGVSFEEFWRVATTERALAAYKLTFGASFLAATVNAVFGTVVAWVLVRYRFPGKRLFDALVDFPLHYRRRSLG